MVLIREVWNPAATPPPIPMVVSTAKGLHDGPVVGQIHRPILIRNLVDVANAESGLISGDAVRQLELTAVLIDTGASHLCLPQDMVDQLGLRRRHPVVVQTATTEFETWLYGGAEVFIEGRDAETEVLALPAGRKPLFGVLPMEAMGMRLNMLTHSIDFLPNSGAGNYVRA